MALDINLLENSFDRVRHSAAEFSATFYKKLFAYHPELKPLGELTFYEWLDLYGEASPEVRKAIATTTHFKYRNLEASN